jgi:hypothetical protein
MPASLSLAGPTLQRLLDPSTTVATMFPKKDGYLKIQQCYLGQTFFLRFLNFLDNNFLNSLQKGDNIRVKRK